MSNNTKDLSASSHSIASDEGYVYISMTDPIHKGVWSDPAEFVWAIWEYGRKILLAGFLSREFSPEQIAIAFRQGRLHAELSAQHGQMFGCNTHDIVNAYNYMSEKGNVKFQQSFNEKNRKAWEEVPEQRMEVAKWIHELKKGTYFPWYIYTYSFVVFNYRFAGLTQNLHLVTVKNTLP